MWCVWRVVVCWYVWWCVFVYVVVCCGLAQVSWLTSNLNDTYDIKEQHLGMRDDEAKVGNILNRTWASGGQR